MMDMIQRMKPIIGKTWERDNVHLLSSLLFVAWGLVSVGPFSTLLLRFRTPSLKHSFMKEKPAKHPGNNTYKTEAVIGSKVGKTKNTERHSPIV